MMGETAGEVSEVGTSARSTARRLHDGLQRTPRRTLKDTLEKEMPGLQS